MPRTEKEAAIPSNNIISVLPMVIYNRSHHPDGNLDSTNFFSILCSATKPQLEGAVITPVSVGTLCESAVLLLCQFLSFH